MLKHRTITQLSGKLLTHLDKTEEPSLFASLTELRDRHQNEYMSMKQIDKEPTVVYQMFGKKTSELTDDEFRQYKNFLKRMRTRKRKKGL